MKIFIIAGARPNFTKIAPIIRAFEQYNKEKGKFFVYTLIHTGQHYDYNMSDSFFEDLGIPEPDFNLSCKGGSHAEQTASIMIKLEELALKMQPDMILVVGDVNSTLAAAIVAKKLHLTLIHVEAGLRSGDKRMPEEINRIATDSITDIFFTTEPGADRNLEREGHSKEKIFFVGNVMIDNLFFQLDKFSNNTVRIKESIKLLKSKLPPQYLCMTLHRPSNVDKRESLKLIISNIRDISRHIPVIFPCHPRTLKRIFEFGLENCFEKTDNIINTNSVSKGFILTEPLGYNDFLFLWKDATGVLTDSGGLQEETTALNIPCITLRENTERPVTVEVGSNILIGNDMKTLKKIIFDLISGNFKDSSVPKYWDGNASKRIAEILASGN